MGYARTNKKLIPLQLPLSPMRVFAIGLDLPDDMPI
jgi:hypothetical protein